MIQLFKITALLFLVSFYSCDDKPVVTDPDPIPEPAFEDTIRFASYNVSMFGSSEGQITEQLQTADQFIRFRRLATVIQNVQPDVLVLMEFDYDSTGEALKNFNEQLLAVSQIDDPGISYEYMYQIPSNTGQLADVDLSGDGDVELPEDAFGFGQFPGQYASAILSKFPIDLAASRSFKRFLWKDMPNAALPTNSDGSSYYSEEALNFFRISSKNHIDLPIVLPDNSKIHCLISHPTPPVFDGTEDRNGKRNHDEIRLWADYIDGQTYLLDDTGVQGGLVQGESFIIFGDLNADPLDGDSFDSAMNLLLDNEKVNQDVANGDLIPRSTGGMEHNQRPSDQGDPAYDTSFFGLRIDYVLPSSDLTAINSGVFWPGNEEEGREWVANQAASDHLMVWVDVEFK